MEDNTSINYQKPMPHDSDAEKAVLGSAFIDKDAIFEIVDGLKTDDFYRAEHRSIFDAMMLLFSEGKQIDVITVKSKLEQMGVFNEIGGLTYLADIATFVSSSVNIKNYIEIVNKSSVLRKLIKASADISQLSYDAKEDVSVILDKAEKAIFDISENRNSDDFVHVKDITVEAFNVIEKIYTSKEKITGIATGFIDFDTKTAGLQKSDLVLLAARPSMGKTAFALNIAQNAAIRGGVYTAVFSLEMSKEQLVNRMLCSESMVDSQNFRTGNLQDSDWEKLIEALGPLSQAPIYIDDTPGISPMEMRAKCRKLKLEKGLGLILIDYLQLMSSNTKSASRQQEISDISRSLKALAREMECPVVALSQLSRACEQRADHRPMLSDLRESGAIEQDADVVAFLYRDEYYFPESEKKGMAELIIAKQRNGPTGTVDLTWLERYTRFGNALKNSY